MINYFPKHYYPPSKGIQINQMMNRSSSFYVEVTAEVMMNAGINKGDIVLVDRQIKPENGRIVIAILNGETLIRRFEKINNKIRLIPETPRLAAIDVDPNACDFFIWGVVTHVIQKIK